MSLPGEIVVVVVKSGAQLEARMKPPCKHQDLDVDLQLDGHQPVDSCSSREKQQIKSEYIYIYIYIYIKI